MKPSKNTPRFASTRRKILRTDWTRALTLLFIIVALGSLVLSSVFAERNSATSSGYAGPDPLKMSALEVGRSNQDSALSSGAKRVEMEPVKPKIFHGDVGRLPLVKPKIRKPRPEPLLANFCTHSDQIPRCNLLLRPLQHRRPAQLFPVSIL